MPLKYVTPPKQQGTKLVGNEETGILEFPVFAGLSVDELDLVEEILFGEEEGHVMAAQLAQKISESDLVDFVDDEGNKNKRKLSLVEAYMIVNNEVFGRKQIEGAQEITIKYAKRISEIAKTVSSSSRRRVKATVTALIRCRQGEPEWSMKDTGKLPVALQDEIYELSIVKSDKEKVNPPTENDLKKQPEEGEKSRTNWSEIFYELCSAYPGCFKRESFHKELASDVLKAWEYLQKQKREAAHMAEVPSAQIAHLLHVINSSSNGPKPKLSDFMFFASAKEEDGFPPKAAAVAIGLLHEKRCPDLLVAIWPEVQKAAPENAEAPEVRALRSVCRNVWVIAPALQEGEISGLFVVNSPIQGTVELIDIDRPFYRVSATLPGGKPYQYIEEMSVDITSSG